MTRTVFRVQDSDGRGPFRPGLSKLWIDESEPAPLLPTWMEEFGWDAFKRYGKPGEHFGSACSSLDDIGRWFNRAEREKLSALGFRVVSFGDARVLAESPNQLLIARTRPFRNGVTVRRWP